MGMGSALFKFLASLAPDLSRWTELPHILRLRWSAANNPGRAGQRQSGERVDLENSAQRGKVDESEGGKNGKADALEGIWLKDVDCRAGDMQQQRQAVSDAQGAVLPARHRNI